MFYLKTERSYKKSKKHKKKGKKRRHKSVSVQEETNVCAWCLKYKCTGNTGVCTNCNYDKQASPDSDNEKKGRDRDGKREKEVEKEKENDKSRGKSRSESKQKSPKRKAAKEEVNVTIIIIIIKNRPCIVRLAGGLRSKLVCFKEVLSVYVSLQFLAWDKGLAVN